MKKALIVSLNFSPGHWSHMIALAKLLEELQIEPSFLLEERYKEFIKSPLEYRVYYSKEVVLTTFFDVAFIQNPSTKNHTFVSELKQVQEIKILYIYHEPKDRFINTLKEGIKGFIKAVAAHQFNKKVLKLVDAVILPSEYGLRQYQQYDAKYNKNAWVVPLLFDDEAQEALQSWSERNYFSYIGTAAKAHNFEAFVGYMKYHWKRKTNFKFLLATKSDLTGLLSSQKWIAKMQRVGKLEMLHGKPLSNKEINACYAKSLCNWNIYSRTTQSGVLPKAFMFGTPVVASPLGSFPEYVKTGFNGEFISNAKRFTEIDKVFEKIRDNFDKYSENARNTFLKTFYYRANISKLSDILSIVLKG